MTVKVSVPGHEQTLSMAAAWVPIIVILVVLRFYSRIKRRAQLLADDWLIVPSAILTLGTLFLAIWGVKVKVLGYKTPTAPKDIDPKDFHNFEISTGKKIVYANHIIQVCALTCIKLSYLFFYKRIFDTHHDNIFRKTIKVLIIFTGLWGLCFLIAIVFQCGTRPAGWWTTIRTLSDECPHALDIELGYATSDFISDLAVIVTPIIPTLRLKMSLPLKLAVLAIFSLGALTIAASITRMVVYFNVILHVKEAYKSKGADNDSVVTALFWTVMESCLALAGACLPTIYSLFADMFRQPEKSGYSYPSHGSHNRTRSTQGRLHSGQVLGSGTGNYPGEILASDEAPIVNTLVVNTETYAEGGKPESIESHEMLPMEGIVIQKSFGRAVERNI